MSSAAESLSGRTRYFSHRTAARLRRVSLRGAAIVYLGAFIALPVAVIIQKGFADGLGALQSAMATPGAWSAIRLTLITAALATVINAVMGTLLAYILVRYEFWGKGVLAVIVDLPLAIPTLVTGLALRALYQPSSPIGGFLERLGIQVVFAPLGILLALLVVTLPFVIRAVQPVLLELDPAEEEAAAHLGRQRLDHVQADRAARTPDRDRRRCPADVRAIDRRDRQRHRDLRQHPEPDADGAGLHLQPGGAVQTRGSRGGRGLPVQPLIHPGAGHRAAQPAQGGLFVSAPATVVTPPTRDVEPTRPPQDRRRGWVRGGLLALALTYLSALLLLPLVGIVWTALSPGWSTVKETFSRADVLHAFQLTLIITVITVIVTAVFGVIVAGSSSVSRSAAAAS